MKAAVTFILLLVASGICTTLAWNGNEAKKELVPDRTRERLGDRFNADAQTSNWAHWRGRMNGAAGELVPGRMRERLGDRFDADAPRMQLEEAKKQKIGRSDHHQ